MLFKALTWNIKSGHYQDEDSTVPVGNELLRAMAQVIAEIDPDVVCLQEVEVDSYRSQGLDQTREICSELIRCSSQSWRYHFMAARQMNPGYFGNAIISPHNLQMSMELSLPRCQGREDRSFLLNSILINGKTIQVGTFHLGMKDETRQAIMIKDWLQKSPISYQPVLLGGDLNCSENTETYLAMRDFGFPLLDAGPSGCTFRCYSNDNSPKIDFWFYSADFNIDGSRCQIIPVDISDHRPLLSVAII